MVWFPEFARTSKEHYPGLEKGDTGNWQGDGRPVVLCDNTKAQTAWARYAGRPLARKSGYGVRHIWGNPWDPDAFTAAWNLCYMPYWAGMLTEEQHPHEELQNAIKQAAWFLFFSNNPVCEPPSFAEDPGIDLDGLLEGQPILVLRPNPVRPRRRGGVQPLDADLLDRVRAIRRETNRSWINIYKAARSLQVLDHEPFGTQNVGNSARACVRRIHRETGLNFPEIERLALDQT